MKALKTFLLIATFSITFFTANAAIEPVKTTADLETQLSELILESDAFANAKEAELIKVRFMITTDSKLLVLSTTSQVYDKKIKSILNYEKLDIAANLVGKVYVLPVRVENK